jgi:hypothetical protein
MVTSRDDLPFIPFFFGLVARLDTHSYDYCCGDGGFRVKTGSLFAGSTQTLVCLTSLNCTLFSLLLIFADAVASGKKETLCPKYTHII